MMYYWGCIIMDTLARVCCYQGHAVKGALLRLCHQEGTPEGVSSRVWRVPSRAQHWEYTTNGMLQIAHCQGELSNEHFRGHATKRAQSREHHQGCLIKDTPSRVHYVKVKGRAIERSFEWILLRRLHGVHAVKWKVPSRANHHGHTIKHAWLIVHHWGCIFEELRTSQQGSCWVYITNWTFLQRAPLRGCCQGCIVNSFKS